MASKVYYGIKNVYVAPITLTGDTITYGTPFAVKGAVGLSCDPEGDTTDFYADGIKYFSATANQGYSGDLELAMTPIEFLKQILGETEDKNSVLFENKDDVVKDFALLFEADGDDKKRRFCFYNCHAERPSAEHNTTEESIEVGTETLAITMNPKTDDGYVKCICDENSSAYSTFFDSVYEFSATEGK